MSGLRYLCEDRGLHKETIIKYRLGYNPVDTHVKSEIWGQKTQRIWIPRGIVIPCYVEGQLWYVNIRRPKGKPKYYRILGSKDALFGTNNLHGALAILMVFGEFDTMLVDQEIGDVVGVISFGRAIWNKDLSLWRSYLIPNPAIFVAIKSMFTDMKAFYALEPYSYKIYPVRIPGLEQGDKDLTDYFRSGGDLREWFNYNLENHGLVPKHQGIALSENLPFPHPSVDDLATTPSTNLSVILNNHLAGPYEPDISQPCFACGLLAWRERPPDRGGGWLCGVCHPSLNEK